jgi:acetoin utilization protein AcuB
MRVQDVMTRGVTTVTPATPAVDAWNLMRLRGIHHLVVTDPTGVVGVVSDRDGGGRRGSALRTNKAVADLMSTPAVTVEPTTTVRAAANTMRGRSIGCLVAVKSGRPVGIVTVTDLLQLLGQGGDRGVEAGRRWTLRHRSPHRKQHTAARVW